MKTHCNTIQHAIISFCCDIWVLCDIVVNEQDSGTVEDDNSAVSGTGRL